MATISSYSTQISNHEADWKGPLKYKFRWSKWEWQWGRRCYIAHPIEGISDYTWWEWTNDCLEISQQELDEMHERLLNSAEAREVLPDVDMKAIIARVEEELKCRR